MMTVLKAGVHVKYWALALLLVVTTICSIKVVVEKNKWDSTRRLWSEQIHKHFDSADSNYSEWASGQDDVGILFNCFKNCNVQIVDQSICPVLFQEDNGQLHKSYKLEIWFYPK